MYNLASIIIVNIIQKLRYTIIYLQFDNFRYTINLLLAISNIFPKVIELSTNLADYFAFFANVIEKSILGSEHEVLIY